MEKGRREAGRAAIFNVHSCRPEPVSEAVFPPPKRDQLSGSLHSAPRETSGGLTPVLRAGDTACLEEVLEHEHCNQRGRQKTIETFKPTWLCCATIKAVDKRLTSTTTRMVRSCRLECNISLRWLVFAVAILAENLTQVSLSVRYKAELCWFVLISSRLASILLKNTISLYFQCQ